MAGPRAAVKKPHGRRLLLLAGVAVVVFLWLRRGSSATAAVDPNALPLATDGSLAGGGGDAGTAASDAAQAQADQLQAVLDQMGQLEAAIVASDQDTQGGLANLADSLSAGFANEQSLLEDMFSFFAAPLPPEQSGQPTPTTISAVAPVSTLQSSAPAGRMPRIVLPPLGSFVKPPKPKATPRATLALPPAVVHIARQGAARIMQRAPAAADPARFAGTPLLAMASTPMVQSTALTAYANLARNLGHGAVL